MLQAHLFIHLIFILSLAFSIYYGNLLWKYFHLFILNLVYLSFNSAVHIWILILCDTVHKVKKVYLEAFFTVEKQVSDLTTAEESFLQ